MVRWFEREYGMGRGVEGTAMRDRSRARAWWIVAVALVLGVGLALAVAPAAGRPPSTYQSVVAIASQLRCPVCSGESAAASDTAQAIAMRQEIAKELAAGRSAHRILAGFVAQYGTWILARPPRHGAYALLWLAPVLAVAAVTVVVARYVRLRPVRQASDGEGEASAGAEVPLEAGDADRRLPRYL